MSGSSLQQAMDRRAKIIAEYRREWLRRKRPRQAAKSDGAETRALSGGMGRALTLNNPETTDQTKENPMLFREFNIIAAAAYAAQGAADDAYIWGDPTPLWDELTDEKRGKFVEQVLAISRGEDVGDIIFQATVKAILDFNGGQGGLALERIADLGQFMVDQELVAPEEAEQGGDIVDHAKAVMTRLMAPAFESQTVQ